MITQELVARFRCVCSPVEGAAEFQHAQLRRPLCSGEGSVKTQPEHELLQGSGPLYPGERTVEPPPEEQVLQERRPFHPNRGLRQRMLPVKVKLEPFLFLLGLLLLLLLPPLRALPAGRSRGSKKRWQSQGVTGCVLSSRAVFLVGPLIGHGPICYGAVPGDYSRY